MDIKVLSIVCYLSTLTIVHRPYTWTWCIQLSRNNSHLDATPSQKLCCHSIGCIDHNSTSWKSPRETIPADTLIIGDNIIHVSQRGELFIELYQGAETGEQEAVVFHMIMINLHTACSLQAQQRAFSWWNHRYVLKSFCSVLATITNDCLFHIRLCARFTQICTQLHYKNICEADGWWWVSLKSWRLYTWNTLGYS